MYQEELTVLTNKYKRVERTSLEHTIVPDEKYLCIRLDGFNATKKFLKDELINNTFNLALMEANKQLFRSFRYHLNKNYTSSIVCSFIANDEISIVLNKDNDNYDKRIMKLCTLFSGVLSSAATLTMNTNKNKVGVVAFDSRPIILGCPEEITEYLRYRYLVSKRYAYWKVLRLNNFSRAYDDDVKFDIDNAINHVVKRGEEKDAKKVIGSYRFLLPEQQKKPQYTSHKVNRELMSTDNLHSTISSYLQYLHSEQRCA